MLRAVSFFQNGGQEQVPFLGCASSTWRASQYYENSVSLKAKRIESLKVLDNSLLVAILNTCYPGPKEFDSSHYWGRGKALLMLFRRILGTGEMAPQ